MTKLNSKSFPTHQKLFVKNEELKVLNFNWKLSKSKAWIVKQFNSQCFFHDFLMIFQCMRCMLCPTKRLHHWSFKSSFLIRFVILFPHLTFLVVFVIRRHNDLPWNIRKFLKNQLREFRFGEDLRGITPWSTSQWSHTDLRRLKEGMVSAQVSIKKALKYKAKQEPSD